MNKAHKFEYQGKHIKLKVTINPLKFICGLVLLSILALIVKVVFL